MSEKYERLTPACAGALFGIRARLDNGKLVESKHFHAQIRKRLFASGLVYTRASEDPLTPWGGGVDAPHVFLTPRGRRWMAQFDAWLCGRYEPLTSDEGGE